MPAGPQYIFDARRKAVVAELARLLLPETDTPGAVEAGVPTFIETMVLEWCTPAERRFFFGGLDDFNQEAVGRYGADFPNCAHGQKVLLMRQAEAATTRGDNALIDPAQRSGLSFFAMFKGLAINGFFCSDVGCTRVLRYLPAPGRYVGDWPIDRGTPQWSSLNGY